MDKPLSLDLPEDQPEQEPQAESVALVEIQTSEFAASFEAAVEQAYGMAQDSGEESADSLDECFDEDGDFIPLYPDEVEEDLTSAQPSQDAPQGDTEDTLITNERRLQKALDGFGTPERLLKLRQVKFI